MDPYILGGIAASFGAVRAVIGYFQNAEDIEHFSMRKFSQTVLTATIASYAIGTTLDTESALGDVVVAGAGVGVDTLLHDGLGVFEYYIYKALKPKFEKPLVMPVMTPASMPAP